MAKLSNKKQKFIKRHYQHLSVKEIAKQLKIKESEVNNVIRTYNASKKGKANQDRDTIADFFNTLITPMICMLLLIAPLLYYPHLENFSNLPKATFLQFMAFVLCGLWLLKSYRSGKIEVIRHPVMIPLALWLLWSGISIFWSVDKFSGVVIWIHWCLCTLCFIVLVHSLSTLQQVDNVILCSVISASIIALIGIMQYVLDLDIIPQTAIPGGTFSNKNMAAQFVIMLLPLSFLLFLIHRAKKHHIIFIFMFSLLFIFLVYTRTRAAWLAGIVSSVTLVLFVFITGFGKEFRLFVPKYKVFCGMAALVFILLMAQLPFHVPRRKPVIAEQSGEKSVTEIGQQIADDSEKINYQKTLTSIGRLDEGTAKLRLIWWMNTLPIIKKRFPTGVGLGNWHIYYPLYHRASQVDPVFSLKSQPTYLHNDLLQLLAETSAIGGLLYISIFIVLTWRFFVAFYLSSDTGLKLRLIFSMMAIMGFFINSMFTFPIRMAIPPLFLMTLMGIVVALDINTRQDVKSAVLPIHPSIVYLLAGSVFLIGILITGFNVRMMYADHHYLRSAYFNGIKNWQMGKREAEKAASYIPWQHKIWFELAKANDKLGLHENAIHACLQALRIHPYHMNSLLNLGYVYIKEGELERAKQRLQQVLDIKPDLDKALFLMGETYKKQNLPQEAIAYYRQTIASNPQHVEARVQLGIVLLRQNSLTESRRHLEEAVKLQPDLLQTHFYLGLLYTQLHMPEKARSAYQKEIRLNPNSVEALTNLGLLFSQQKELEKAITLYKRAVEIKPDLGAVHINIAAAYYMLKEYDLAWKHCKIAEKMEIPQAKKLREKLQEVSKEPEKMLER